jgi:glycerate 2-kinase
MRVLIAPQEFKGSLTADEAANAIREGLREARPGWQIEVAPMADGGPGFIEAMRRRPSDLGAAPVRDPLGRKVLGRFVLLRESRTAVIEAAQANGLLHLAPDERDPLNADSYGVGQLILAALEWQPAAILVGVGGSATTDGGAGMARALGSRFLDESGRELPPGGAALADLARIHWQRPEALSSIPITVATDVTNPLVGPNGAAAIYGPQKGASPPQVDVLEAALLRYASVVRREMAIDIARIPGGGAAGGLAAGLAAFLGARIVSGFDVVAEVMDLPARLASADLVITGEGGFDGQSTQGKVTGRILELAAHSGTRAVVFAGRGHADTAELHTLLSLEPDPARAQADATTLLRRLAREWAERQ